MNLNGLINATMCFRVRFGTNLYAQNEPTRFFASGRMDACPRSGDGFTQRCLAQLNASWLMSDLITDRFDLDGHRESFPAPISYDTPVAPEQVPVDDPKTQTAEINKVAKIFGADLCGITHFDERWLYQFRIDVRDFSDAPNDLPPGMTSVIVLSHEMDADLVNT